MAEKLIVRRGFGLTDHLRALEVNQTCFVPLEEYSLNVIYVAIHKLKQQGYRYKTQRKKPKRGILKEIQITRTE